MQIERIGKELRQQRRQVLGKDGRPVIATALFPAITGIGGRCCFPAAYRKAGNIFLMIVTDGFHEEGYGRQHALTIMKVHGKTNLPEQDQKGQARGN